MKAIELRLKNYVFDTGVLAIVTCIEENRLSTNCGKLPYSFYDEVDPVPLTKEWLLKFGFKYENLWECYFHKDFTDVYFIIDSEWAICGDFDGSVYIKFPKYVHQLQNLFFALTGNELEINE